MESAVFGAMMFVIFFGLAVGLLIAILFLLNLQNTIKAAAPQNRKMPPANVWLLLIPIFNTYYYFVVVKRITETIKAEYDSKNQVLDNPKPTFSIGMALAISSAVSLLISLITIRETIDSIQLSSSVSSSGSLEEMAALQATAATPSILSSIGSFISFVGFILWIIYWVQTAGYKNKMKTLPNNRTESQIFGQF